MRSRDRRGFSLLEILAVLGVLSILAAIAVPRYTELQDRTRVSTMKADLYHLRLLQEQYHGGEGSYAGNTAALSDAFRSSPDVSVEIVEADADGYLAVAVHAASRIQCVYTTVTGTAICAATDIRSSGSAAVSAVDSSLSAP